MSYPILYPEQETAFASNGLGVLSDAISCTVTEERNGANTLQMQYPVDGIHYGDLALGCILLAKPDPYDRAQPYRVQDISTPLGGKVTVYADHISYDLSGCTIGPFTASTVPQALNILQTQADRPHPFVFWTDKETSATMTVDKPASIRSLLGGTQGSVLDTYGGEYKFDRYEVRLYNQRGADRGFTIRYGKNLTDLRQEKNIRNTYTGVRPYWSGADGALVELPEKIIDVPGTFAHQRILALDLSQEWQEAPTVEQLRARAERYIKDNDIGVPTVSLDVKFVELAKSPEYRHLALLERVELCDTVHVVYQRLGVEATAKVIAATYNVLLDRYETLSIGDARYTLADVIVEQQRAVQQAPTRTAMQQAIEHGTKLITGNIGGYIVLHDADGDGYPDELLSMDTDDIATAQQVLRINKSGIGFSADGYNGPYNTAWTLDGHFVADFITSGTLDASLARIINLDAASINTGTLTLGGKGKDPARMSVQDGEGNEIAYIDTTGVHITHGSITLGNGALKLTDDGNFEANNGVFRGSVYANKIQAGGDAGYIQGTQVGNHTLSGGNIGQNTVSGWNIGLSTVTGGNIGGDTVARGNLVEKYATSAQYNSLSADVANIKNIFTGSTSADALYTRQIFITGDFFQFGSTRVRWITVVDRSGTSHSVLGSS